MNSETPQFSKSRVDKAGKSIVRSDRDSKEFSEALDVITNWRASHAYPLGIVKTDLERRTKKIDNLALVAQRLKRLPSITGKLDRITTMALSRMQDIGGCRAILRSQGRVFKIRDGYIEKGINGSAISINDYISTPKSSGYRGVHVIHSWKNTGVPAINGFSIEIQLRTRIQHAWATAVETVGTFLKNPLKNSQGPEEWLEFFKYVSSGLALLEKSPVVPNTSENWLTLQKEIRSRTSSMNIIEKLGLFSRTLRYHDETKRRQAHFYLMVLKPDLSDLQFRTYKKEESKQASEDYDALEDLYLGSTDTDVVLVAVDSLSKLKQAYPNYFADTDVFLKYLDQFLSYEKFL